MLITPLKNLKSDKITIDDIQYSQLMSLLDKNFQDQKYFSNFLKIKQF